MGRDVVEAGLPLRRPDLVGEGAAPWNDDGSAAGAIEHGKPLLEIRRRGEAAAELDDPEQMPSQLQVLPSRRLRRGGGSNARGNRSATAGWG